MNADRNALRKTLRTNFSPGPRDRLNRVLLRLQQASHLPAFALGRSLDRPVFIIGAPRSGTSLLYAILRSSPELAHWPGEAHEVWEADTHPALRGWESNALDRRDATPQIAASIRRSFFLLAGPRRRLIDKTPRNALRVPFVDEVFGDSHFVFLKRDGRENVNSLINAWRTDRYRTYRLPEPHAIPGVDPAWWKFVLHPGWRDDARGPLEVVCAKQWHSCNEAATEASEGIDSDRWVEVAYEDLIADAAGVAGRVADAVGLTDKTQLQDTADRLVATPINAVTPPEAGKWRRENPREIEAVESIIAPTMKRLGYEL